MARPITVVTVYDSKVAAEFLPGGRVNSYVRKTNVAIISIARATAPGRTGELKAKHRNRGALKRGRFSIAGIVENYADYALWVHDGTKTPILPKHGKFLKLPNVGTGRGSFIFVRSVRGQRANPWLRKAGETVARRMGARVQD